MGGQTEQAKTAQEAQAENLDIEEQRPTTSHQVPPLTAEEQQAWVPLVQAMLHLLATLDDELKQAFDLSHLDYGMLMLLQLDPHRHRRMTEIAITFGVEPNIVTYRMQRLEAHGWVRRHRGGTDKREVYALLTKSGRALLEQATPFHVASVRRHFLNYVSPQQLAVLADIFGPLHQQQLITAETMPPTAE